MPFPVSRTENSRRRDPTGDAAISTKPDSVNLTAFVARLSSTRDSARSCPVRRSGTEESLELAIQQVRAGNRLFDVCGTVERHVVSNGFSIVREFVGHGIGTKLHEEPQIPNYVDRKNENPRLKEGMVLAIEPMVNAGGPESKVRGDKWNAVTKDGSFSAHFEHCVAVTENGPWVLTRP